MLSILCLFLFFFFFNDTATTEIYTLSLHDALPISFDPRARFLRCVMRHVVEGHHARSEEHTSELQSLRHLVCRLLLEKKKTYEADVTQSLQPACLCAPRYLSEHGAEDGWH